ncbi:MAG: AAA family ATPase [Isosphaeraceae bacterium]
MKLQSLSIRNFRGIESLDLDFTDEIGLIRDRVPIVGPNTSGKTSVLDAIALCLAGALGNTQLRSDLAMTGPALIRSGAVRMEVQADVSFSDDEIEAIGEVVTRTTTTLGRTRSEWTNRVEIRWTFPGQGTEKATPPGSYDWNPPESLPLFLGRALLSQYLHAPGLGPRLFGRIGSVYYFDAKRTGLSRNLGVQEVRQLGHLLNPGLIGVHNRNTPFSVEAILESDESNYARLTDPRLLLTNLAMRAQVAQDPKATEKEDFARLKQLYERVCRPHTIGQLFNTEHGLDIEFFGDQGRYYYDGLSGGQRVILEMLLQFATRRIHRSIVLIDELDQHLHPLWQDRLYTALTDLGDDNQYFFTTHSTHLRDTIGDRFYYATGELTDHAIPR